MEEVNREVRQFRIAVPGRVEHVGLRARPLHETGNWLVITDCSNAVNTAKRTAVLAEVSNCVPALTPFVAKCYDTRPADVFFRMNSGETRTIPVGYIAYTTELLSHVETSWGRQCSVLLCDQG